MRVIALSLVLVFSSLFFATTAAAAEVTRSEALELANDAAFDDEALRRLRAIDSIDGQPVDMERLVAGAEGDEYLQRVEALVEPGIEPDAARDPAADKAVAKEILAHDRFQPDEIPRPFRGPLEWIAERLEPVRNAIDSFFGWIARLFSTVARGTPGGAATLWTLLGLVVVAVVVWQTRRVIERRNEQGPEPEGDAVSLQVDDPRELERRAAAARDRGEHDLAVRLLFRAGLLRLARARVIPARPSLTTGQLRSLLSMPEFDALGRTFDEIAYGRRPATDADSAAARSGWTDVIQRAKP